MGNLTVEHTWNYTGNLQELQDYLYKRIEYDLVTLIMVQEEYAEFLEDTCDGSLFANRFRILDLSNECKPLWLFDGQLRLIIKIEK